MGLQVFFPEIDDLACICIFMLKKVVLFFLVPSLLLLLVSYSFYDKLLKRRILTHTIDFKLTLEAGVRILMDATGCTRG